MRTRAAAAAAAAFARASRAAASACASGCGEAAAFAAAAATRTRAAAAVAASAAAGDTLPGLFSGASSDFVGDFIPGDISGDFGDRGGENTPVLVVLRRRAGFVAGSVDAVSFPPDAVASFASTFVPCFLGDVRGVVAPDPTALPVPSGVLEPGE